MSNVIMGSFPLLCGKTLLFLYHGLIIAVKGINKCLLVNVNDKSVFSLQ